MLKNLHDFEMVLCCRQISARYRKPPLVAVLLERAGFEVRQVDDWVPKIDKKHILWLLGNANWYPLARRRLSRFSREER